MKYLTKTNFYLIIVISLFVFPISVFSGGDVEDTVEDVSTEPEIVEEQVEVEEEPEITENPQRNYCMLQWNEYYENEGTDIKVSTRGEFDEIVVFSCPNCSSEEHFIDPFLNTRTYGMTGVERIRACGFMKAVFRGGKGIQEIEREID